MKDKEGAGGAYVGPKIFTLEQANRLIPRVREILSKLRQQRAQLHDLENSLAILELEGLQADGTPSPQAQTVALEKSSRIEQQMDGFKALLDELDEIGCQLKDLDEGLVDFFAIHQGQLVYLCWKDGEETIFYWHRMEDGFAGRRPVTELANN